MIILKWLVLDFGSIRRDRIRKLLRLIQQREFERLGGTETIKIDVRIVCATHRNLNNMITEKSFRDDLYYRLAEIIVNIPSLSERTGDSILLAKHFMKKFAAEMNPAVKGFRPDALNAIDTWDWPGNVRELQNTVHRGMLACRGEQVEVGDLPRSVRRRFLPTLPPGSLEPAPLVVAQDQVLPLATLERRAIEMALKSAKGSVGEAAKALGIGRATLYRRLSKYDLAHGDS